MLTTLPLSTSCLTENRAAIVLGKPYDPNCWPGTWDLLTTISPAICSEGYTAAYEFTDSAQRKEGETVWACCPGYDGGIWQCLAETPGLIKMYTVTDTDRNGDTFTTQVASDKGWNAHSIRVAFHSSDLFNWLISTTHSLNTNTASRTTTSSIIAPPYGASYDSSPRALSSGAWIGIGLAIGGSTLALLVTLFWLIKRRFRKTKPKVAQQDVAQLPSQSYPNHLPFELHSVSRPSELNAVPGVYELETKVDDPIPENRWT